MDRPIATDLFAEDRAHEDFISALVQRLAQEEGRNLDLRVRWARGGHGRAISELKLYQLTICRGVPGLALPDMVVVAIDANCKRFSAAAEEIRGALRPELAPLSAIACPDPHVERWYLADPQSFSHVVGSSPVVEERKCRRDRYKNLLRQAVIDGGHIPTLGGIEFARELANAMDLFAAGRGEPSLKAFVDDVRSRLRLAQG